MQAKVTSEVGSQPKKTEKAAGAAEGAAAEPAVDAVEAALAKYSIITENPWEKGVK